VMGHGGFPRLAAGRISAPCIGRLISCVGSKVKLLFFRQTICNVGCAAAQLDDWTSGRWPYGQRMIVGLGPRGQSGFAKVKLKFGAVPAVRHALLMWPKRVGGA
jgi:hypothetical protein